MSLVSGNTVFGIPVDFAYHLVCWIAAILAPLLGGLATAAAIIAFTMLIRLVLLPLSYFAVRGSVRGEGARARLQPKIAELQRRHTSDPRRLQDELGALQRAEGSGMFGGCLPLLIQVPFLSVMYRLFTGADPAAPPRPVRHPAAGGLRARVPVIPSRPSPAGKPLGLGWGLAGTMVRMQIITQRTMTRCLGAAARAISSPVAAA